MKKKLLLILMFSLMMIPRAFASGDAYIVKFKDGFNPTSYGLEVNIVNAKHGIYTTGTKDLPEEVEKYIDYIEPNTTVELPNEQYTNDFLLSSSYQWSLDCVDASGVWDMGVYGNDVKVAVIDSGCDTTHSELSSVLLTGYNYLDNSTDVTDTVGHGTHVTGIIAGQGANVDGIAPNVKIVPLKCFGSTTTTTSVLVKAVYDAVDTYGCKVINMSWGNKTAISTLRSATEYAAGKGVIMCAAVGNTTSATMEYPAGFDDVIGVGSITSSKTKATTSVYNTSVFTVAPGDNIYSTYPTNSYKYMGGTSMATPAVAAIAALALSVDKDMTPDEFKQLIIDTSEDLGDAGYDVYYGNGLINAKRLVSKLLSKKGDGYISPVYEDEQGKYVCVTNTTENTVNTSCYFSAYSDGKLTDIEKYDNTLEAGTSAKVYTNLSGDSIKIMLWDNLLKPLCNACE